MGVLILSFIFLPLLFCAVLIVLMVPLWEKVVDFLNTVMDYVLPSSNKKTKTSVKSVKKNLSKTSDSTAAPKKKLPFWMQIQRVSPYKKKTALILCLLGLLGIGGLHRIYVRSWFTGILFLCTMGLYGIGTIYDAIMLLMDRFQDSNNLYLESDARKRWDSKNAKWRYVYWSMAYGRYFVDATSIVKNGDNIDCTYMVELNYVGKIPFKEQGFNHSTYFLVYVTFDKHKGSVRIIKHKAELLDENGRLIYEHDENDSCEYIGKDTMDECVYLAINNM